MHPDQFRLLIEKRYTLKRETDYGRVFHPRSQLQNAEPVIQRPLQPFLIFFPLRKIPFLQITGRGDLIEGEQAAACGTAGKFDIRKRRSSPNLFYRLFPEVGIGENFIAFRTLKSSEAAAGGHNPSLVQSGYKYGVVRTEGDKKIVFPGKQVSQRLIGLFFTVIRMVLQPGEPEILLQDIRLFSFFRLSPQPHISGILLHPVIFFFQFLSDPHEDHLRIRDFFPNFLRHLYSSPFPVLEILKKNPICRILPAIEDCLRGGSRKRHLPFRHSAIEVFI